MSARVLQQPTVTLTLSEEERDSLLGLLRQSLGEARVELHRTHTPAFRDVVLGQEVLIRNLVEKLERLQPIEHAFRPARGLADDDESWPAVAELSIDQHGRFQMPAGDLESFVEFLRENKVRAEVEPGAAVHSGGATYGYGRLVHPFDADDASILYRTWNSLHQSGTAVAASA